MSQDNTSQRMTRIPKPEQIVSHLSEAIKGHDQIKKMLACAAYAHLLKCDSKSRTMRSVQSLENCLISGPTASGKSSMLQRLASYLQMPTVTVLTGSLSPAGYKGKTCNDVLDQIEEVAVDNGTTRPTLCIWDEYDKCAYGMPGAHQAQLEAGVYKCMTQSDMLGILQGIRLSDRPGLDLGKVLHVACGAFPEVAAQTSQRTIGFHTRTITESEPLPNRVNPDYYIKMGLMPELVGRFPRLGIMSKPDRATIREIITESVTSPFKQKVWFFEQHGACLQFDDGAIDLLAQMVSEHPTGVRALQLVLTQILGEFEFEITRSDRRSIEEIRFTRNALAGIEDPLVIRSSIAKSVSPSTNSHLDVELNSDRETY
jgi:ATP-dependent Clp protease ATP-binding subunit ClpX